MNRWNKLIFYMLIQICKKADLNFFLVGHNQNWVWPIWSRESKIDCIPEMNI